MNKIQKDLFALSEQAYAEFCFNLTPGINPKSIIGVRIPKIRKYAKSICKNDNSKFLNSLPHKYYEENLLHGFLIEQIKDYDKCLYELEKFIPYIDNWSVCDTCKPKVFKKYKNEYLKHIKRWLKDDKTYTIRYGIGQLMSLYLDEDYKKDYLELVSKIRSDEYYVNMMIAWYFATALAKQYDDAITYIEKHKLDKWSHNKTIQKAIESYRISDDKKDYLRTLRIK
ncbi:MAG: DNA alkylation repair protein [Erysipelotrichaceae bacterium]|nr:DNA alkylation repair protein [Erysipelotrichaceae bacterium]